MENTIRNKELLLLKKAIRNMKNEKDILNIEGKEFSCNWNGKEFEWTAPSKEVYLPTAKEVCNWIGDGSIIVSYFCDIRSDLKVEGNI